MSGQPFSFSDTILKNPIEHENHNYLLLGSSTVCEKAKWIVLFLEKNTDNTEPIYELSLSVSVSVPEMRWIITTQLKDDIYFLGQNSLEGQAVTKIYSYTETGLNQRLPRGLAQHLSIISLHLVMRSRWSNKSSHLLRDQKSVFLIMFSALHRFDAHFSKTILSHWCLVLDDFGGPIKVLAANSSSFPLLFYRSRKALGVSAVPHRPFHSIQLLSFFLCSATINNWGANWPLFTPFLPSCIVFDGFQASFDLRPASVTLSCLAIVHSSWIHSPTSIDLPWASAIPRPSLDHYRLKPTFVRFLQTCDLGDSIDLHHGPEPSLKKWPLMLKKCLSIASQGNSWGR
jgi:hypothetical protein